jgi:hypothetical protein
LPSTTPDGRPARREHTAALGLPSRLRARLRRVTRNAVLVLPHRRRFPGNLTARQRRLLRRLLRKRLRTRRRQWLDSLSLALTIIQEILNQFGELVIADWAQISARLAATATVWEPDASPAGAARPRQQVPQAHQPTAAQVNRRAAGLPAFRPDKPDDPVMPACLG